MKKTIENLSNSSDGNLFCKHWDSALIVLGTIQGATNNIVVRIALNIIMKIGTTVHDNICNK